MSRRSSRVTIAEAAKERFCVKSSMEAFPESVTVSDFVDLPSSRVAIKVLLSFVLESTIVGDSIGASTKVSFPESALETGVVDEE